MRAKTVLYEYFIDISKYPRLSAKEEKEITISVYENLIRYKKEGIGLFITPESWPQIEDSIKKGEKDRDILLKSNQSLVVSVAQKYKNRWMPLEDLIQEGNIGLIKAVEKYDPYHGERFSTYATWWIKQSIRRAINEQAYIIRIPENTYNRLPKFNKIDKNLTNELMRSPTNKEIADKIEVSEQSIETLKEARSIYEKNKRIISISGVRGNDKRNFLEKIIYEKDNKEEQYDKKYIESLIYTAIKKPRDREIIRMRFGFNGYEEMTFKQIGKTFNRTIQCIEQIEKRCLDKLNREILRQKNCLSSKETTPKPL